MLDSFVSVVCPVASPSDLQPELVKQLAALLRDRYRDYEVVLACVDSRSATKPAIDGLLEEVACVKYLGLARATSFDESIFAGLQAAIGDFVVVLPLAHHDPAVVPQLVDAARDGAHIVQGVRASRAGEPVTWRIGAWLFYRVLSPLFGIPLRPDVTYTSCLSRAAANALLQVRERHRFLRVMSSTIGLASAAIPLPAGTRSPKRTIRQGIAEAVSTIITYSDNPLRLAALVATLAAGANLAYMIYIWVVYFVKEQVAEGWVTLSLQNSGMFFLISVILAMLCAYVGRILQETRDRPLHQLVEERHSASMLARPERRNVTDTATDPPPTEPTP